MGTSRRRIFRSGTITGIHCGARSNGLCTDNFLSIVVALAGDGDEDGG